MSYEILEEREGYREKESKRGREEMWRDGGRQTGMGGEEMGKIEEKKKGKGKM